MDKCRIYREGEDNPFNLKIYDYSVFQQQNFINLMMFFWCEDINFNVIETNILN